MKYNNTYALVVRKDLAARHHLRKISDLKQVVNNLTAGFTFEFKSREDGYQGIQKVYHIQFPTVKTMDAWLRSKAIQSGDVDIIDAYSTDTTKAT
ncbi:glycine betaine ABC transporter substrate-binding protein [Aneurinibacillus terranovensis]|uniref:glycine betaine ABC transporter substrate-binding protein n=1 Tax=Aneurinibacillus terranovensis TaxID=278991 RepID=UPI000404FF85|nr:glycine betaine ABC transporter substrate-binding protein [Aneurinibacillus terranovensis]